MATRKIIVKPDEKSIMFEEMFIFEYNPKSLNKRNKASNKTRKVS
jgi:hypothetical protein